MDRPLLIPAEPVVIAGRLKALPGKDPAPPGLSIRAGNRVKLMRRSAFPLLATAAFLLRAAPLCAQEPPELSVGEPILRGKDAEDPVKKSRTPPPDRGKTVPRSYTEEKCFTVNLPDGWRKKDSSFARAAREKKVYGAELFGPAGAGKLVSRISIFYYSPDSRLQKTPEEFVKSFSAPPAGAGAGAGEYGKVRDDEVAGRPARLFDRILFQLVPPAGARRKQIPVYEYFAVIPAGAGFYVLKYYAPKDIAKANIRAFEAVLDSFVPLVK